MKAGGKGSDTVSYSGSKVGVDIELTDTGGSVAAAFDWSFYNPATHMYEPYEHHQIVAELTSIENATGSKYDDTLTGNSGNNTLNGLSGNDTIDGGGGNDTIIGGAGRDLMTGGSGFDTFVFNHASDTPMNVATYLELDRITDFVRGEDHIDLHNLVNETAGNHALSFIGDNSFSGVAVEVTAFQANALGIRVMVDSMATHTPTCSSWSARRPWTKCTTACMPPISFWCDLPDLRT